MKISKFAWILICFVISLQLYAQNKSISKALLSDPEIQFGVTEEVNQMYNFQFAKADSQFLILKQKYPQHPLPYFLLGYSQFWRIMPNDEITAYDSKFYAYMDTVINLAEKIYNKNDKDFEAVFFLTAAYAFKGRLLSDRKMWAPAVLAGNGALRYLKKSREFNELSPEFLFGEGLFNYFAEWIPQNYKAFKPVMWFFPKGNKDLGIKLLNDACNTAFYTRTEAQHYYIKIMLFEENKSAEALPIIKFLRTTYPDNPVFHRLYARILFSMGNYIECESVSLDIIKKINKKKFGYEEVSGRYASFFIGWINRTSDKPKAKMYYEMSIDFSEKVNALKMNYYLYSLSDLAKMAEDENNKPKAMEYYQKIKKNAERKEEIFKNAKKYLNAND